ncbi:hybrid sensor histidine kinase/response regulator [Synoicihabitans lomoniglobus]|uniref:histidine kinase n=1 Tax=Synoicihabitans lomoniglobus TaxID=2909285 RepID=A0AAF0CR57_9BACT|nr:HAMP domain-containing histidine kinase [Opitutaceae bacterium LMO-M01]WED66532.1 HAMP domain-containing sensor histidine kinase [Opitutaceae bacterium LMO-M01]
MDSPTQTPAEEMPQNRVLLVLSEAADRDSITEILLPESFSLEHASSPAEAQAIHPHFQPDLVILDLPNDATSITDFLGELGSDSLTKRATVIVVLAVDQAAPALVIGEAEIVDFMRRPFRTTEVLARVRNQIAHRRLQLQHTALISQRDTTLVARDRFMGMAAHDLRNPLASIRGLSELLRDGAVGSLTSDQRELVESINEASESMHALLNEMLDFATIEAGKFKFEPAPHDLVNLIDRSLHPANIEAAKKSTRLLFLAPKHPPLALIDAAKIRQVLENLLSNAVKYSPPGSTITVEFHAKAHHCGFAIKDQGPGIPAGEHEQLFRDFGRLSVRPTGGESSTGLGLAICQRIVNAHGGTIEAENLAQGGCEFRVTLPLAP